MVDAGNGTMLLVVTTREAKLGLIFLDLHQAAKAIAKVL